MIKAFKDSDSGVRWRAAEALGKIGDKRAVGPLIEALKDSNWLVRDNAAEALGEIGWKPRNQAEKISYLIAAQKWDELVKIGKPAVKPLIKALKDSHWNIREAAVKALGNIGDKRAVGPLIEALQDSDWHVCEAAAKALDKINPDTWPKTEEVKKLVPEFIETLMNPRTSVQATRRAAKGLGLLGDKRAVEPLIQALDYKNAGIRYEAVIALGKIGDKRAIKPLKKTLIGGWFNRKDSDEDVRKAAAEALGRIGGEKAVEPLINALEEDSDKDVRQASIKALGETGDKHAVEPLIEVLHDSSSDARSLAAQALVKIGKPAIKPLVKMLNDPDSDVRGRAVWALDKIGWKPTKQAERINYLIASQRWDDLVKLGEPAILRLIHTLRDSDSDVRNAAAAALGRIINNKAPGTAGSVLLGLHTNFNLVTVIFISLEAVLFLVIIIILNRLASISYTLKPFGYLLNTWMACGLVLTLSVAGFAYWYGSLANGLALSFIPLKVTILGAVSFLLFTFLFFIWPWIIASRDARLFLCSRCFTRRFAIDNEALPRPVRWWARCLVEEKPKRHKDFQDYFRCSKCEGSNFHRGITKVIGIIDGNGFDEVRIKGSTAYVHLWDDYKKEARGADVDVLEIHNAPEINYHHAINAVLLELRADLKRPRDVKDIPVRLVGNPQLTKGELALINKEFKGVVA